MSSERESGEYDENLLFVLQSKRREALGKENAFFKMLL